MAERQRTTFYLTYQLGEGPQQTVLWDTTEITVGRLETSDIVLEDEETSREHAVFRRKKDECSLEDLASTMGTMVNGERITHHELEPGDVFEIGPLVGRFGRTTQPVKPGENVRYASELKGFHLPPGADTGSGRTMLAFDASDEIPGPPADVPPQVPTARVVSAEGTLEESDGFDDLGSDDFEDYFDDPAPPVRDLDLEFAQEDTAHAAEGAAASATPPGPPAPSSEVPRAAEAGVAPAAASASDPTPAIEATVNLELEVRGPTSQLQSVLSGLLDKEIIIPPLRIRIKKPRES